VHLTRPSNGWPETPCPSDPALEQNLKAVLSATLKHFSRIIIDNRLFFDCTCGECDNRRNGRTWTQFHCDELNRVLREWVLDFATMVNPDAHIIFKFPSWHEMVRTRGYDVLRQAQMFPEICAGVETRDPDAWERWGGRQPYGAYFTAGYFRNANPAKCRMAWFDSFACDEIVYAAQAWGAVLSGAEELTLYDYGSLFYPQDSPEYPQMKDTVQNLAFNKSQLCHLREIVRKNPLRGILAYRPVDGDAQYEPYFHDYLGMLGLPLLCVHDWSGEENTPAALGLVASSDPQLREKIVRSLLSGTPMIITSRLVEMLALNDLPSHAVVLDTHSIRFTERMWRFADQALEDTSTLPRADEWFDWEVEKLESLRRRFYKILEAPLMQLPARVGVFPAGKRLLGLANYNSHEVKFSAPGRFLFRISACGDDQKSADNNILAPGSFTVFET
jgi:hypothetical protein